MHTKICSASTLGVNSIDIEVEVDLALGLLTFTIVGLPDTAIKESKQRIVTALKNCGIKMPERKITINLAPADVKKEGTLFDLPIAIGIAQSAGVIELSKQFLDETIIVGELSLDGAIRGVRGILPIAYDGLKRGKKRLILPKDNALQAGLIKGIEIIGVEHLTELIRYLKGDLFVAPTITPVHNEQDRPFKDENMSDVIGQTQAKRMLQIAAAGYHNILFIGSPGCGKTMLARRITSIMPSMSFDEIIATSKVYSVGGKGGQEFTAVTARPFRSPHHSISAIGMVGGGAFPQPGELSLAHNGVLFLDELMEFNRSTLESLRQPLEQREVCISRAQYAITFPANFLLIGALNPCPCGFLGHPKRRCACSTHIIARYTSKLSGPLLDRFDLQGSVPSVDYETIRQKTNQPARSSEDLYKGVLIARAKQIARFGNNTTFNAHMSADMIQTFCPLSDEAENSIKKVFETLSLSMRGYHKLLKVARTIADMENVEIIEQKHIQEAIMYRSLDKNLEKK